VFYGRVVESFLTDGIWVISLTTVGFDWLLANSPQQETEPTLFQFAQMRSCEKLSHCDVAIVIMLHCWSNWELAFNFGIFNFECSVIFCMKLVWLKWVCLLDIVYFCSIIGHLLHYVEKCYKLKFAVMHNPLKMFKFYLQNR